jgi:hypothetical protein
MARSPPKRSQSSPPFLLQIVQVRHHGRDSQPSATFLMSHPRLSRPITMGLLGACSLNSS